MTLNGLNTVLDPRVSLYLLLRRQHKLIAITFVPYLAQESQRRYFMEHRHKLVQLLGEKYFSQSLVCKEIGEVLDARSWTERDEVEPVPRTSSKHAEYTEACHNNSCKTCTVHDLGYKRNRCRLCDRRMMNKIDPDALDAVSMLSDPGFVVQLVRVLLLCTRSFIVTKSFSLLPPTQTLSVSTSQSCKPDLDICHNCFLHLRRRSHSIVTWRPQCSTSSITLRTSRPCNNA
jgi:hypothetical protein